MISPLEYCTHIQYSKLDGLSYTAVLREGAWEALGGRWRFRMNEVGIELLDRPNVLIGALVASTHPGTKQDQRWLIYGPNV